MHIITQGYGVNINNGSLLVTLGYGSNTNPPIIPVDPQILSQSEVNDYEKIMQYAAVKKFFQNTLIAKVFADVMVSITSPASTLSDGLFSSFDKIKLDRNFSAPQTLTGPGDIDLTVHTTKLISTGFNDLVEMDNGLFMGQRKVIMASNGYTGGNSSIIFPGQFADGLQVKFTNKHDSVEFEWNGSNWKIISLKGSATVL